MCTQNVVNIYTNRQAINKKQVTFICNSNLTASNCRQPPMMSARQSEIKLLHPIIASFCIRSQKCHIVLLTTLVDFSFQHQISSCCHIRVLDFSALMLLLGRQEGHLACKKMSGGMLAWLCVWVKVQVCIWPSWYHCHSLSLAPINPD